MKSMFDRHAFHLTLSEGEAVDLRLALHRALHSVQKIVEQYKALDQELFDITVAKYEAEADQIKRVLDLATLAWEDLQNRKEAEGTLEQAAWHDTSAELQ